MKIWQKLHKNRNLWERYFTREKIIQAIRAFFQKEGFHEVETPLLVSSVIPESYNEVFTTTFLDRNRKTQRMFLATSPEASLKKLIAAGIGNCFEITKSFRNGESESASHNPEFTILEWYRMDVGYEAIMRDCENLLLFIQARLEPKKITKRIYQGKSVNLKAPWERISMEAAFIKYVGISFDEFTEDAQKMTDMFPVGKIAEIAQKKGYSIQESTTWEELFNQIFLNEVEPYLGRGHPTILYGYPAPLAALSRISTKDPRFAERFELYIEGLELADCYSELTNHSEQKKRFERECEEIEKQKKTPVIPDMEYLQALSTGLPRCSGIAVGVDRLCMLFANVASIQDILLFPHAA